MAFAFKRIKVGANGPFRIASGVQMARNGEESLHGATKSLER